MQLVNRTEILKLGAYPIVSTTLSSKSVSLNETRANMPLTLTQFDTLDKLIINLQELISISNYAIWSKVRQEIGLAPNEMLLRKHFTAAKQLLQNQLVQEHVKNNKFLQFSSKDLYQLEKMTSAKNRTSMLFMILIQNLLTNIVANRAMIALQQYQLSSVEQNHLNQIAIRLSVMLEEPIDKIWNRLTEIQHNPSGMACYARHFLSLIQYLQTQTDNCNFRITKNSCRESSPSPIATPKMTESNIDLFQKTETLSIIHTLFQPMIEANERQLLLEYSQKYFYNDAKIPLTQLQLNELMIFLFAYRIQHFYEKEGTVQSLFLNPQLIANAWIAKFLSNYQSIFNKSMFWFIISVYVIFFLF